MLSETNPIHANRFPNKSLFLGFCSRLYKSFENSVGKREIAHDEQLIIFLLFPTEFLNH